MKAKLKKLDDIISWVMLIAVFILLIYVVFTTVDAARKGEENFIFGYRPAIVLTGSMEPYMMTNSVVLTKEVTSLDQLEVGDVISFHLTNDLGEKIRITHRLTGIEDGVLSTKGDNNPSGDGIPLTMENVESKVIAVCNQTAYLIAAWQTTAGKIMILCALGTIFFAYLAIKLYFSGKREAREVTYELLEEYSDLAGSLGKTPRELFLEDLDHHKAALSSSASSSPEKNDDILLSDCENSDGPTRDSDKTE